MFRAFGNLRLTNPPNSIIVLHDLLTAAYSILMLTDAGDDAPSRKETSHVPVRQLLRKDVKNNLPTPSTRILRTTSTHLKFSASNSFKRKHAPPSDLLKLYTQRRGKNKMKESPHSEKDTQCSNCNKNRSIWTSQLNPKKARRSRSFFFSLITTLSSAVTACPR